MPGKHKRTQPCHDCGEPAEVWTVTPKRHDDGWHRCKPCHRVRRAAIIAYWRAAMDAYQPEQNRGGVSRVGVAQ
jgi:hypothetical protein